MQQIPITIREEIETINVASIPHILLRFLTVVEDDRSSIKELATLVGQDPALCTRFLTVANSPALRREKDIISIEQCMITLGTRLARTLAACLAIQSVFARTAGEVLYDFRGFWGHSLRVAEMSRAIAVKKGYIDSEEAYLAGLIHDIGLPLLLGIEGDRYGELLLRSIDESVLSDIEKPIIGTDHAAVGAWMVDHWKLSSFVSDAVQFHHKTLDEIVNADPLSQIVWSSHVISGYNEKLDLMLMGHTPDLTTVMSVLGIDIKDVAAIRDQASEQVAVIAAALGMAEPENVRPLPSPILPLESCRSRRNDNDPVQSDMDNLVRDMALLQTLQQNLSSLCSEEDIFIAVKESARILFNLGRVAFLLVNPDKNTLTGANFLGQSALLKKLEIKLDPSSSLAATVALGERPCSTFDKDRPAAVSLADVQIAHTLDSEGLMYVPMRIRDRHIGVMVYGITVSQHSRIQKRLDWMTSFAGLAAISIEAWREMRNNEENIETNVTNRFKLLARKAVHEAGNPLSIIKNYLKIVTQKLSDENDVRLELNILREEIDRVSHILQRLDSLNEAALVAGAVDINSVIEGMLSLYGEPLFSACGITVEKTLDPSLPPITGDRDSIKQILLNIWKNATEAMSDGGRISIATRGSITKNGRPFVEIVLSDSGPGLPQDVKQRLFQPLEQGRRIGHSGLGLSIIETLVEQLEGFITCQSDAGHGTTFRILLPCSTGKEQ